MPPRIQVNQEDIKNFYKQVEEVMDAHGGQITSALLFKFFHTIEYYYDCHGEAFLRGIISDRYVKSGKKHNGYDIWIRRNVDTSMD